MEGFLGPLLLRPCVVKPTRVLGETLLFRLNPVAVLEGSWAAWLGSRGALQGFLGGAWGVCGHPEDCPGPAGRPEVALGGSLVGAWVLQPPATSGALIRGSLCAPFRALLAALAGQGGLVCVLLPCRHPRFRTGLCILYHYSTSGALSYAQMIIVASCEF